jgi:signal transduction histidine kinase
MVMTWSNANAGAQVAGMPRPSVLNPLLPPEHDVLQAFALEEVQELIDGLVEQVALVNCDGRIIAVNKRWRRQVEQQARYGLHISRDYDAFLSGLIEDGDEGAAPILKAFREIAGGTRRSFHCIYRGSGAFEGYDFNVVIAALHVHEGRHVLVSVHDVTELVALKRERRRVGTQLLRAQEHERRRVARELHDSTSQSLLSLRLSLGSLEREQAGPRVGAIVAECRDTLQQVEREIRALSFLAHPPSLTTHTLETALHDLVRGFAARTGLDIDFNIAAVGEASPSVEAAIFRVSQEALSNIYRHAQASHAFFHLVARERYLHLVVRDDGVGLGADRGDPPSVGVGVAGMDERVRELGGRLSIRHAVDGTTLTVSFPRREREVLMPATAMRR